MLYLGDDRVFGKEKRRRVQSETDPADPGQSISTHEIQCGRENSKWVGIKLSSLPLNEPRFLISCFFNKMMCFIIPQKL